MYFWTKYIYINKQSITEKSFNKEISLKQLNVVTYVRLTGYSGKTKQRRSKRSHLWTQTTWMDVVVKFSALVYKEQLDCLPPILRPVPALLCIEEDWSPDIIHYTGWKW